MAMAILAKRNRKMIILSFLYILAEVLLALFFFGFGLKYLSHFNTLGENTQLKVWNEQLQIYERKTGDNSMLILLFSVLTIAACILFAFILILLIRNIKVMLLRCKKGEHIPNFKEVVEPSL